MFSAWAVARAGFASVRRARPSPPPYEPRIKLPAAAEAAKEAPGLAEDLGFVFQEPKGAPEQRPLNTSEAALQAQISNARSLGHLLDVVRTPDHLDALHAATALYKLARLGPRKGQQALVGLEPVGALIQRLGEPGAVELDPQASTCLLWAVARLGKVPWLSDLANHMARSVPDFSGHQLATALYALARLDTHLEPLLEALHLELQRRQKAMGPGATSAMDTILIVDSLAKLQIRDEALFSSLAQALRNHLDANELGVREARHAASAFASAGLLDKKLTRRLLEWLTPRLPEITGEDLAALAFFLSRAEVAGYAHRSFFEALQPEVMGRVQRGELGAKDAASFIVSLSQAGLLEAELVQRLVPLIQRSPAVLNGHFLALVVPCISPFAQSVDLKELMEVLAERTNQLAMTLSPRQLARLAIGFGEGQVKSASLWQSLAREALSKSQAFSAPDALRLLTGFHSNVQNPRVLKTFWALVAEKKSKYLVEELLALLQLWPQLPPDLRTDPELPRELVKQLRNRLEKGNRGLTWQAPAALGVELWEWLASGCRSLRGGLDQRLLKALMAQLPRQLDSEHRVRLLHALCQDPEIFGKVREELQQQEALRVALGKAAELRMDEPGSQRVAAETVFHCAQLGVDDAAVRKLLRSLLDLRSQEIELLAKVCWACAELRMHAREARELMGKLSESDQTGDAISWFRLAWSALALSEPRITQPLLHRAVNLCGEGRLSRAFCDDRPLQQLAWHSQQHFGVAAWSTEVLQAGPTAPRGATAEPGLPAQTEAEKMISSLLQQLRVPHVVARTGQVGLYRLPIWFPDGQATLELDISSDRLASGSPNGQAQVRRQQLREAGLTVHVLDPAVLRSEKQRLRAVAEAVAHSCPEAEAWLNAGVA
ncbi:unnamed protein product [Effrenium voratum]|nr:unnamed protein product [Effrenium voratum]